jgi:hypothetical protein
MTWAFIFCVRYEALLRSWGALQANLLTGVVNMSMYTIFVAPAKAFATVLLYALAVVGLMGLADFKKLRLKFW